MGNKKTDFGTKSWRLEGAKLKNADFERAKKLNEFSEKESFYAFRKAGICWVPTRELLIDHLFTDIDIKCRTRRHIAQLAGCVAAEFVAIVVLAVMLLTR